MDINFSFIRSETFKTQLKKDVDAPKKQSQKLSYTLYENAFILPATKEPTPWCGGVAQSNGNSIAHTSLGMMNNGVGYVMSEVEFLHSTDRVIYIGYFHACWGHLITDEVSMLWFLRTSKCQQLLSEGWKLAYVGSFLETEIPQYIVSFLRFLDLDLDKCMYISAPTQFSVVCVPDKSFFCRGNLGASATRIYTDEYINTINQIKCNIKSPAIKPIDKLYFTRSQVKNNREMGEVAIERLFKSAGYQIIAPEKLSIEEQIFLVRHCTHFAATEGSVAHHSLFCQRNTKVTILQKTDCVNTYQMTINEIDDLDVTYITAHHSSYIRSGLEFAGPFYLCPTPELAEYLGLSFVRPYWLRLSYWWYRFWYSPFSNRYIRNKPKTRRFIARFCNEL